MLARMTTRVPLIRVLVSHQGCSPSTKPQLLHILLTTTCHFLRAALSRNFRIWTQQRLTGSTPVLAHAATKVAGKGRFRVRRAPDARKWAVFRVVPQTLLPLLQRGHRNPLRSALALSRRGRQRRDLPQHAGKQPPRQVTLRQQQPVVAGVFYQPPTGFHQPLLKAGQRPTVDPRRQRQPPPQVAEIGRVAPRDCSPEAPTDPDMRISRIRLFGPRLCYVTVEGRMRGCGSVSAQGSFAPPWARTGGEPVKPCWGRPFGL